jgi:formylglycine-generating enzyme required for sulfatase activity
LLLADLNEKSIQVAIQTIEGELGSGRAGLNEAYRLLKKLGQMSEALREYSKLRIIAERELLEKQRTEFREDYLKFQTFVKEIYSLAPNVKLTAVDAVWRDIVARWNVSDADSEVLPLYWYEGKVRCARRPEAGSPAYIPLTDSILVWIAPNRFDMGSSNDEAGRDIDEGPLTRVLFSYGYWLASHEVTQGQYELVMGKTPSYFLKVGQNAPVEQVSWHDAMAFCDKLTEIENRNGRLPEGYSYTLPSEAQWEFAARAGTGSSDLPEKLDDLAWFRGTSGEVVHLVGQKTPNLIGIYDLLGNVSEWCLDWKSPYPGRPVEDYCGPASGSLRVHRGGNWADGALSCRIAIRFGADATTRSSKIGFRIALSRNVRAR